MNWVRLTVAVLVILAIGAVMLPADTATAAQGGDYCKKFCAANHKEFGGMGSCVKMCRYYYFEPAT